MSPNPAHQPWPFRMALATVLAAIPLVFFGGSVTTLNAGMAVDGWWVVERGRGDWFMWTFPIDQWVRDTGTFVEHTHRLFGSLVGLLSVLTVILCWSTRARWIALAGLLSVIGQGTLGGFRVLENSPDLAFLHGALGQAVFAFLVAVCIATAPAFQAARSLPTTPPRRSYMLSIWTTLVVYAQIVIGAWLRHGESMAALLTHLLFVLAVIAMVFVLAKSLSQAPASSPLTKLPRWLFAALTLQIVLGVAAYFAVYVFVGRNPETIHAGLFPTLHVMGGAALLSSCAAAWIWTARLCSSAAAPNPEPLAQGSAR